MKPDQAFQKLKELAEQLGVVVKEHSLKHAGIQVRSGFCKVKGTPHCILDSKLNVRKKVEILAEALSQLPHEDVFILPALRELLDRHAPKTLGQAEVETRSRTKGETA